MSEFASRMARRCKPYTPGEQPRERKYIKLNTNENPYGPSPRVKEVIGRFEQSPESLRLYPDPTALSLREAIAENYQLRPEEIFVGNGSDEVLAFCFMAFADDKTPLVSLDITYSFYPVWAELMDIPYRTIPLREDLTVDTETLTGALGGNNYPVVLANPNAPTGLALTRYQIEQMVKEHPRNLFIIDEAYVDFGAESMVPLIDSYPNLLVVQTCSKSRSLASIRLGYAMGQKELIDDLNRVKNSFNSYTVSAFTQEAGRAAMEDEAYTRKCCERIASTRDRVKKELIDAGFDVTDSQSNFLWICYSGIRGEDLYEKLRQRGVLVRHFTQGKICDHIRVTVGTDEDMDVFLQEIKAIVGGSL